MGGSFLNVLDQFRYVTGSMAAILIFCTHALTKRSSFRMRVLVSYLLWLAGGMAFFPFSEAIGRCGDGWAILTAPYWFLMSGLKLVILNFCYENTWSSILFRATISGCAEGITTIIIRYFLVLSCFPQLPEDHPVLYIVLMLAVYIVCYYFFHKKISVEMRQVEREHYLSGPHTFLLFGGIFAAMEILGGVIKAVCEYLIIPLKLTEEFAGLFYLLQYFCVGILMVFYIGVLCILIYLYKVVVMRSEMQILTRMILERQSQYEFSRENIEMINRKCHDLKHQLRALEAAGDEERRELIRETKRAVDFYDAVVKTGNEALDTILTDKSVYCVNRNIRLSCTVNTDRLSGMQVMDLYTLLGNAIDNAIESVEKLEDPDKKVISLTIRSQGQMLHISVENYYEGTIVLRDGYPVTSKPDRENHGYGVRSIRLIAQKYGGDIQISTQNQIFSLQILLPV